MYTEELKKLAADEKLKLDYEMMENDLRNNIKLGGRRLYLLIANGNEEPAPQEEGGKESVEGGAKEVLEQEQKVPVVTEEKTDVVATEAVNPEAPKPEAAELEAEAEAAVTKPKEPESQTE